MTIGEVSRHTGLRASAIRFYEKTGLLPAPFRSSGQRRYDASILGRLAVLKRAKECGFTLEEARQIFEGDGPPSPRWQRLTKSKIAQLNALEQKISGMKDLLTEVCSCGDIKECGRKILDSSRASR